MTKKQTSATNRFVRCLSILFALAMPVLLARCTPAWLPDSSGFLYVAADGTVLSYDLEAKKSVRIAKLKSPLAGLAVLPTGDRVAIVHFPDEEKPELQVSVYTTAGEKLHESPLHKVTGMNKPEPAMAFLLSTSVSPDGKHLVTFPPSGALAVTYDFEKKTFREYEDLMSMSIVAGMAASSGEDDRRFAPMGFDVPSATPDGKGFIAVRQGSEGGFVFLAWGSDDPVMMDLSDEDKKAANEAGNRPEGKKSFGVATIPRWEEGALVMRLQDSVLRADLEKRTCTFKHDMRGDGLLNHAEKHDAVVITVLKREMGKSDLILQMQDKQLQLVQPGREAIALNERREEGGILAISISPDGQKILSRSMADGKDTVEVFNLAGQKLATLGP